MKYLFTTLLTVIALHCTAQIDSSALARVKKMQGIEIYIQCEPLRKYEVTGSVNNENAIDVLNAISGTETEKRTIKKMIDVLIDNANRKKKKGKVSFDAILTEDGETGTLIKFQ